MIKLININKKYNDKILFKDLNLTINHPGIYLVEGDSGCGKSTLLNIIGDFISYKGKLINDHKDNMAYVFQNSYLIEHLSVKDNFNFYHLDLSLLNRFNLSKIIDSKVTTLSMGEKSRLAYIIGMYSNKELVLLDEPFSNLDKDNALILIKDIMSFKDKKIIILVSHIYKELLINYGGRILIKNQKVKFKEDKTNKELLEIKTRKLKIDLKYLNKEFKYYFKDNIKIYFIIFILMLIVFLSNCLKGYFYKAINIDTANIVSHDKYYLSECSENKINNITVNKCFNPSKNKLDRLDKDKIKYRINYDFILNNLFNSNNISTYLNQDIHLLKGRLPKNSHEVLASNKYSLNEKIILKENLVLNDLKVDIIDKDYLVSVVGIYPSLNFYNDNNIYFNYEYIDNYLDKEMLINNQISLKKYFNDLEMANYKYVVFTNKDINYLTLFNPTITYYKNINQLYLKSSKLIDYLLLYLIVFSCYLIYRFNKNRMNIKKKTNAFLIANSFNKNYSKFISSFYDIVYISFTSISFIILSLVFNYELILIEIFILLVSLILFIQTNYYFNKSNVGKLMREEVW